MSLYLNADIEELISNSPTCIVTEEITTETLTECTTKEEQSVSDAKDIEPNISQLANSEASTKNSSNEDQDDAMNSTPIANRLRTNNFCSAGLECRIRRKALNSVHQKRIDCTNCGNFFHQICINPYVPISMEAKKCAACTINMFLT